ncbi:17832_t:CDS:1, partial [Rhizophagus irregularis]
MCDRSAEFLLICHMTKSFNFNQYYDCYACHLHYQSIKTYKNVGTIEQCRKCGRKNIEKSRFQNLDEEHIKKITSHCVGVFYKKEFS